MINLSDYKELLTETKEGYSATLAYSNENTVELLLTNGEIINYRRDSIVYNMVNLSKGNRIHFDKDFNFVRLEEVKTYPVRAK